MKRLSRLLVSVVVVVLLPAPARADARFAWPVTGPVIRGFDGGTSPYSSGHRGIDIAVPFGTPVRAPADGVVSFAGSVGGSLYVSIDHAGGVRSTASWLSAIDTKKGNPVSAGEVIAYSGTGHPGATVTHVHFSIRIDGVYVDPMTMLAPLDLPTLIRLAEVA